MVDHENNQNVPIISNTSPENRIESPSVNILNIERSSTPNVIIYKHDDSSESKSDRRGYETDDDLLVMNNSQNRGTI